MLLALGGLLMIYSASMVADSALYHDSAYHLKRQILYLAVGLVLLWACSRLPLATVRSAGWVVWWASVVGLLAVLVVGATRGGATRWIDFGFFTLQPSEFAKLGCLMVISAMLADRVRTRTPFKADALKLAFVVGLPFLLVMLQPDMGTAMSIAIAVFFLLVIGGLPVAYILAILAAAAVALPVMIAMKDYRASRYLAFLDPSSDPLGGGYQIIQAMLAFGSGGVPGVGLGLSGQKWFYLPAAHTDFIFAILGEELGLWGTLLVVAAFAAIAWAGLRIAASSKDPFGRLLAGGLTIVVVVQAAINMASVTGLMPVTGIPLPLVSFGGNSVLFTMGCVGLILTVARHGRGKAQKMSRPGGSSDEERDIASTGERRRNGRPRLSVVDGGGASARRRAV